MVRIPVNRTASHHSQYESFPFGYYIIKHTNMNTFAFSAKSRLMMARRRRRRRRHSHPEQHIPPLTVCHFWLSSYLLVQTGVITQMCSESVDDEYISHTSRAKCQFLRRSSSITHACGTHFAVAAQRAKRDTFSEYRRPRRWARRYDAVQLRHITYPISVIIVIIRISIINMNNFKANQRINDWLNTSA